MYYFGYGSNMLIAKLKGRCSSAKKIEASKDSQFMIRKHQFWFRKKSADGSSKGDIEKTDDANDIVYGVLFRIDDDQKPTLDYFEGKGEGYDEKSVLVIDEKLEDEETSNDVFAQTYYATNIDSNLEPYDWYKRQTVQGAQDNKLPERYIKRIESFEAKIDDNDKRKRKEEKYFE